MRSRLLGFVVGMLVGASLAWTPPAHAKGEMLMRSVENVTQAPLDFALIPYTAPSSLVRNYYRSSRHGWLEKTLMTPVMGFVYLPACTFMSGFLPAYRFLEGALLFPFGAALAPTDVDFHLYEPVHGKWGAVVDREGEVFDTYFGGYYCEGFFK